MTQRSQVDTLTRSRMMARVRSKDTTPELKVRRTAHQLGYRFRLHRKDLPGTPDLCFPGRRTVIFVHGCFWHQHENCARAGRPKTGAEFWDAKLDRNAARDAEAATRLQADGWKVVVMWECEIKSADGLEAALKAALGELPNGSAPTGRLENRDGGMRLT